MSMLQPKLLRLELSSNVIGKAFASYLPTDAALDLFLYLR